ncbi:hypothetical protein [Hypericibacter sp.]|uniref:hypothetical protein n=1 Tax=Hypericibacter sp. TaxID=2705401 RepID=UPI003D6D64E7
MFEGPSALALRTFLPAKDFAASRRFYLELGFVIGFETEQLALLQLGDHSFLLQNFHVEEWAANCMMQLTLADLDGWWNGLDRDGLVARHGVRPPVAPRLQAWRLKVAFLFDPSGVLWHVTQAPAASRS